MPSFNDVSLRNLAIPQSGQVTYKDGASPLSIRVSQGGSKTFFVTLDGTGRRHVIGRYGEVTLAQARGAAKKLRAEKTLGRILPTVVSLTTARQEYLDNLSVRSNTKTYYERNLKRLRFTRLTDIGPRDLQKILDPMGHASRIQALRTYSAFFNWCIRRHYLETSPCARMIAGKSTSRARVLSDAELKAIWHACDGTFGTVVKLLILTGQRRGEIAALDWGWISKNDRTISFPASATKNNRAHMIPFGDMSYALMDNWGSNRFLFLARGKDTPINGWSKNKGALDKRSGAADWTLHDLRRTFATRLAEMEVAPHVIERLLNHVSGTISGVAAIYNRATFMKEMREAVEKWEAHLAKLLVI